MSEKTCDILIVGCELPGLITGAFLAKRGLSVMVLNPDHAVEKREKNVQPNLISHLSSRLFKTILGRLSIVDTELEILHRYETPYQIVLPQHRIDVTVARNHFYKELKREFPKEADSIRAFYLSLDELDDTLDGGALQELILPRGILQRIKFARFVRANHLNLTVQDWMKNLNLEGEIHAFLQAQFKLFSSIHCEEPFSYPLAKLLANENSVLFDLKGGLGQLKKVFLQKIESCGGKVRNQVQIDNLIGQNFRIRGVNLAGFEGIINCRYLLWNQSSHLILPRLPGGLISRYLSWRIGKNQAQYARFTIQYEIDEHAIPVGMKNNLLFVRNPQAPLFGTNFLHLHFYYPPRLEENSNVRLLNVTYLLEKSAVDQPDSSFEPIHEEITQSLHALMPFSQNAIRLVFPRAGSALPTDLLFALEETDHQIFKRNATENLIYEIRPRSFQKLFPFLHRTPYKNLLMTGPEILASLGFEGEFLLGLKTTELIWQDFEKKKMRGLKKRRA